MRKTKGQKLMRATTLKKVFPANRMGRDFVIGDIHGCYDDVMRLLSFVQFNRYNDRLFSVGDLIHRGDKSEECLSLLKESWFFSALGNHDVLEDQSVEQFAQYNVNHKPYEKEMEQMPFLIEVKHDVFGSFFVTHGELESNVLFCLNNHSIKHDLTSDIDVHKNLFQSDKHNLDFVEQDMSDTIIEIIQSPHWKPSANQIIDSIWSREIFNNFFFRFHNEIYDHDFSFLQQFTERVNKLKIFCGHSIVPFPMAIGNQIYCDTGACYGYDRSISNSIISAFNANWGTCFLGLTLIEVDTGIAYTCVTSEYEITGIERGDIIQWDKPLYDNVFQHRNKFDNQK